METLTPPIRHGRSKPAAWLVARGAPPDALGWGGGWLAATQIPRQAVAHEIQNVGGRHSCSTSQIQSAVVDTEHQPRLTRKGVLFGEFARRSKLDSNRARLATADLLEPNRRDLVPDDRSLDGCVFESTFTDDQPDGTTEPPDRHPGLRDAVREQSAAGDEQNDGSRNLSGSQVVATHEQAENPAGGHDNGHEQVALGTAP